MGCKLPPASLTFLGFLLIPDVMAFSLPTGGRRGCLILISQPSAYEGSPITLEPGEHAVPIRVQGASAMRDEEENLGTRGQGATAEIRVLVYGLDSWGVFLGPKWWGVVRSRTSRDRCTGHKQLGFSGWRARGQGLKGRANRDGHQSEVYRGAWGNFGSHKLGCL